MKTCFICNKEFKIKSDGSGGKNRDICYDCLPHGLDRQSRNRIRKQLLYRKAQQQKVEMGCQICGYKKSASALEWHHPGDDKDRNPSDLIKDSWEGYQDEIKKCILLCANCHREVHDDLNMSAEGRAIG